MTDDIDLVRLDDRGCNGIDSNAALCSTDQILLLTVISDLWHDDPRGYRYASGGIRKRIGNGGLQAAT